MIDLSPQHISRDFVLPLSVFEYLKQYQRAWEARSGKKHNNSQVIAQMLAEHKAYVGLSGNPSAGQYAALLSPNKREGV